MFGPAGTRLTSLLWRRALWAPPESRLFSLVPLLDFFSCHSTLCWFCCILNSHFTSCDNLSPLPGLSHRQRVPGQQRAENVSLRAEWAQRYCLQFRQVPGRPEPVPCLRSPTLPEPWLDRHVEQWRKAPRALEGCLVSNCSEMTPLRHRSAAAANLSTLPLPPSHLLPPLQSHLQQTWPCKAGLRW